MGDDSVNEVDPSGEYRYSYSWDVGPLHSGVTPESAIALIENDPAKIFPFPVSGCKSLYDGVRCTLAPGPSLLHGVGTVLVENVTPTSFSFSVVSKHYFDPPGSTITFSTSASGGDLYLTQCANAPKANWFFNAVAPPIARIDWEAQAVNLNHALGLTEPGYMQVWSLDP